MQRTSEARKMYVPFYRLYTPVDIAESSTGYYNFTETAIVFGTGLSYRRLFRLPLISGGILSSDANIVVKITVGFHNDIRTGHHGSNPKFLISDGEQGVGFEFRKTSSIHYRVIEGAMGETITVYSRKYGAFYPSDQLPEEFVLTLAPSQKWGSCFSNGLISPATYVRELNLNERLWLEVYAENASERYLFNYIIVEIHENEI